MDALPGRADGGGPTGPAAGLLRSLRPAAVVRDRHFDVLAANAAAENLSSALRPGQNLLRSVFLADAVDDECVFDEGLAETAVALLRDSLEQHEQDDRFASLIGELSARSIRFSELWAAASSAAVHTGPVTAGSPLRIRFAEVRPVGEYELTIVVMDQDAGLRR